MAERSRNIFFHKFLGGNFRLDSIQAAVLLVNLPLLEKWSAARRRNAAYYNAHFQDSRVGTPFIRPDCVSIYNQYVIRVQERDGLAAHLKEHRIGAEIYYPRSPALAGMLCASGLRPGRLRELYLRRCPSARPADLPRIDDRSTRIRHRYRSGLREVAQPLWPFANILRNNGFQPARCVLLRKYVQHLSGLLLH
jgi:hypothetical protein